MRDDLKRQDRNGVRTASELQRRYKFEETEKAVEETAKTVSSLNAQFDDKVDKIPGKGLSTNDFSNTYKQDVEKNTTARHTHINKTILDGITQENIDGWNGTETSSHTHTNKTVLDGITQTTVDDWDSAKNNSHTHSNKIVLDGITQTKVNDWDTAKTRTNAISYDLSAYKVSALTILRSSCVKKNNRVVINFVGTINMAANVTTTLFNLPSELQPTATKDFVLFGSTNNNDGYIGYGYITDTGLTQVRFSQAITSYIRFSLVYDLD